MRKWKALLVFAQKTASAFCFEKKDDELDAANGVGLRKIWSEVIEIADFMKLMMLIFAQFNDIL